jgi:hypothetical protein
VSSRYTCVLGCGAFPIINNYFNKSIIASIVNNQCLLYTTLEGKFNTITINLNTILLLGKVVLNFLVLLKANWAVDWIVLIEGLGLTVPNHVTEDIIDSAESLYLYALVGMSSMPDPRLGILLQVAQDGAEGLVDELLLLVECEHLLGEVLGAGSLVVVGVAGPGVRPLVIWASCPGVARPVAMPAVVLLLEEPMGLLDLP